MDAKKPPFFKNHKQNSSTQSLPAIFSAFHKYKFDAFSSYMSSFHLTQKERQKKKKKLTPNSHAWIAFQHK